MAKTKAAAKSDPKKFLSEIATDPKKLGEFILDPDRVMTRAGIDKKHWDGIKNGVGIHVHQHLTSTPESYTVVV